MNLREEFNRMDHEALDTNAPFYDLRSLVEAVNLSNDDKTKLKGFIDNDDAAGANDYLQGLLNGNPQQKQNVNVVSNDANADPVAGLKTSTQKLQTMNEKADLEEEEELEEGRYDLRPVRKIAKRTGKAYYAAYDPRENHYAEYKTPYRWDTKQGCNDAIHDSDKDLGYELGSEGKNESFNLDESLFEARDIDRLDPDMYVAINNTVVPISSISPEIFQMIKKPMTKTGKLFDQAKALIAIYEQTIYIGEEYTTRPDVLKAVGVALYDREGQNSTWFNDFGKLKLAHLSGGKVYPGVNLQSWVEGTATGLDGNPMGIDLRKYVGSNWDMKQEQGANPNKSHRGRRKDGVNTPIETNTKEPTPTRDEREVGEEHDVIATLDMFEGVEYRKLKEGTEPANKKIAQSVIDKTNRIRSTYREACGLDEDCEITEENIDDHTFNRICATNGWSFNHARHALTRKDI